MKKYTHAWLAFMAIKRLQEGNISRTYRKRADSLIDWFMDHKDSVMQGAWYPDSIIKDMATSHVLKYQPKPEANNATFKKLPTNFHLYAKGKKNPLYKKPYSIESGNLPDRCESIAHSIIDNLKMLESEPKGSPICPTNNHIATLFFMLSHYIADAHMPLHCDARSFSSGANIHAKIEGYWDDAVKDCYEIDADNERFIYNPEGYPQKIGTNPITDWLESEIKTRDFTTSWGTGNNNTWDFMKAITQYSYLAAYELIPESYDETNIDWDTFISLQTNQSFEEYSQHLLIDAIDSIAKVWLRVWNKYQQWLN